MTDDNSFTNLHKGLDEYSSKSWIYPTNFPIREYQYNIVETALFNNTLVSLPTGLGKTMIAAVVMYNIYRWYPTGRVIFMAPTRPLVTQQKEACRQITGLPIEHIAELTGEIRSKNRTEVWNQARVIFLTPQVLMFDLASKVCPKHLIRCLVVDEAHRARGNHAYCEVVKHLGDDLSHIRILALSATPGSTSHQVVEVVKSLNITRLEVRTEASPDVRDYVFERKIETIVVPFCEMLKSVINEYIKILDQYTRRLINYGIFKGSARNLHKGTIFMVQKHYKQNCQRQGKAPEPTILQDLNFCLTLYHAYDVLIKHGFRGFISFYNDHQDKGWIQKNLQLSQLLERIQNYIGVTTLEIEMLPDGTIPEVSRNIVLGHPKFKILRDIVEKQLKNEPETRVIVFFEYRESVLEAYNALLSCRPVIRPRMFLGQSSITQRQQLFVMTKFRSGECNTLLCTSVGEEGLDIAAVELIVCFDIANKSPVRLIQRIGRTGRHGIGKVIMLVTEGREQKTLEECLQQSETLNNCLLNSPELKASLLVASNPSLLPPDIKPTCHKMFMTVAQAKPVDKKKNSTGAGSRKRQVNKWAPCMKSNSFKRYNIPLQTRQMNWNQEVDEAMNENLTSITDLDDIQSDGDLASKNKQLLVKLNDITQDLEFNLYSPKRKNKLVKKPTGKILANKDIRTMFQKTTSITETNEVTKIDEESIILLNLITEVNTKKSIEALQDKNCTMCVKYFKCEEIAPFLEDQQNITIPKCPPESTLKSITSDNLLLLDIKQLPRSNNDVFDFTEFLKIAPFSNAEQDAENITTDNYMNNITLNKTNQEDTKLTFTEQEDIENKIENIITDNCINNITLNKTNQEDTKLTFTEQENIDNKTENIISIPKVPVIKKKCTDKCNFTEYVLDKESRETLNFFGLDSIESLFDGSEPCRPFGLSDKYRKLQNQRLLERNSVELEKSPVLSNRKQSRLRKRKFESFKQNCAKQKPMQSDVNLNTTPISELDSISETDYCNNKTIETNVKQIQYNDYLANFSDEDIFGSLEDADAEILSDENRLRNQTLPERNLIQLERSPVVLSNSRLQRSPVLSNSRFQRSPVLSNSRLERSPVLPNLELQRSPVLSNSRLERSPVLSNTKRSHFRKMRLKLLKQSNTNEKVKEANISEVNLNITELDFIRKEPVPSTSALIVPISKKLQLKTKTDYCNKTVETKAKQTQNNNYLDYFSDEDLFGSEDDADAEVIEIGDSPNFCIDLNETVLQIHPITGTSKINSKNDTPTKPKKKTKIKNPFLCTQAEVDSDVSDEVICSDTEEDCSFITEASDESGKNIDMQAIYLQSIKNSAKRGTFKIPQLPQMKINEVYSQNVTANDSYLLDSFCVDNNFDCTEISDEDSPPKARYVDKKFTRIIQVDSSDSD